MAEAEAKDKVGILTKEEILKMIVDLAESFPLDSNRIGDGTIWIFDNSNSELSNELPNKNKNKDAGKYDDLFEKKMPVSNGTIIQMKKPNEPKITKFDGDWNGNFYQALTLIKLYDYNYNYDCDSDKTN